MKRNLHYDRENSDIKISLVKNITGNFLTLAENYSDCVYRFDFFDYYVQYVFKNIFEKKSTFPSQMIFCYQVLKDFDEKSQI